MMDLIVNFTPTGMVPTKKMTPHVPVSAQEIIEQVARAVETGITMVHLHARDEHSGEPTHAAEAYGKLIGGIRRFAPDLVICVSLSGRNSPELEKRAEPLQLDGDLKPDMGSLTLASLNFSRQASLNAPEVIIGLASRMKEKDILPELEAFDLGMINYSKYLLQKGLLRPPHYFNLLLGNIAGAQADLLHAGMMVRELPENSFWSLAGIGDQQLAMNAAAIAMGGGVRVGLEDNIYFDASRSRLATNDELLDRVHRLADLHGRRIMSAAELRERLSMERRASVSPRA